MCVGGKKKKSSTTGSATGSSQVNLAGVGNTEVIDKPANIPETSFDPSELGIPGAGNLGGLNVQSQTTDTEGNVVANNRIPVDDDAGTTTDTDRTNVATFRAAEEGQDPLGNTIKRNRRKNTQTILTGPRGVTSSANVRKPTLLGA